ncbi:Membrane protein involved in the export of O-antigen and teichoic acid [Limimonas halophila]|uniref:Membrane protein involved in the export of O-antigen and teichoic acid n=1 Tax=Limimonas halophila TaxID=1082479 RepID=A0A1G7L5G1_9PROT|nr:lipopolysaccharide biosynthesis protein [Limimonas halophila]SDF44703.1 Membrane protein involved in the export of O-antigen and teichoic acid [Limimonas halophila]
MGGTNGASDGRSAAGRALRNAGKLTLGRTGQGVMGFAAIALAARALGTDGLGQLAVLQSVIAAVAGLIRFDTTATVVRYAGGIDGTGEPARLGRLLRFAAGLDGLAALAASLVAVAAVALAGPLVGVPPDLGPVALVYAAGAGVLVLRGTPQGVLQTFDRFGLAAWASVLTPTVRVVGAAALWAADFGLPAFLWLWLGSQVASRGVLIALALRVAHAAGVLRREPGDARGTRDREHGIWAFAWGLNATRAFALVTQHGTILLAGALLGPAGAGLVRVARAVGEVVRKPVQSALSPAVLRELAQQMAAGLSAEQRTTVRRTAATGAVIAAAAFAVVLVAGKPVIEAAFGADYTAAYPAAVLLALANVGSIALAPVRQLIVASGRMVYVVGIPAVGTTVQITVLTMTFLEWGVIGVGIAGLARVAVGAVLLLTGARRIARDQAVPAG